MTHLENLFAYMTAAVVLGLLGLVGMILERVFVKPARGAARRDDAIGNGVKNERA
jgi:hypothetical protein